MKKVKAYYKKMYELRFFWMHLTGLELKNKFRRSKLGFLWTFVSPLCLSGIMGTVFATVFHLEIMGYVPYVLSGMLFWDLVNACFNAGGFTIIGNEGFIRQCNHPLTMYTFKSSLVYVVTFLIALISLILWIAVSAPLHILLGLLTLPLTLLIYFAFSWAATTIAGYTCAQYRDYPMMAPLALQVVWYVSPIFFQKEMFESSPAFFTWFQINPVTHMLNLLREPMLYGRWPSPGDYAICFAFVLLFILWAVWLNKKKEKDIIFYL